MLHAPNSMSIVDPLANRDLDVLLSVESFFSVADKSVAEMQGSHTDDNPDHKSSDISKSRVSSASTSSTYPAPSIISDSMNQSEDALIKKKRRRRTAAQIDRKYRCTHPGCAKAYGSEGSLTQHQRLKHMQSDGDVVARTTRVDQKYYGMLQLPSKITCNTSHRRATCIRGNRNINIRPAIRQGTLQEINRQNTRVFNPTCVERTQTSAQQRQQLRSRSNSLPLVSANECMQSATLPCTSNISRNSRYMSMPRQSPLFRGKCRSQSECFFDSKCAVSSCHMAEIYPKKHAETRSSDDCGAAGHSTPMNTMLADNAFQWPLQTKAVDISDDDQAIDNAILAALMDDELTASTRLAGICRSDQRTLSSTCQAIFNSKVEATSATVQECDSVTHLSAHKQEYKSESLPDSAVLDTFPTLSIESFGIKCGVDDLDREHQDVIKQDPVLQWIDDPSTPPFSGGSSDRSMFSVHEVGQEAIW